MEEERWTPVKGFDLYEVSNLGRIRYKSTSPTHPSKLIKQCERKKKGYVNSQWTCALRLKGKYYRIRHVARLVLESFTNERHKYIIFKDGDRFNCTLSNLAWSDDKAYAWSSMCRRDEHIEIILRYCRGESTKELAEYFNTTISPINCLVRGDNAFHHRKDRKQYVYDNGTAAPLTIFTDTDVKRIRKLHFCDGFTAADIAKMYSATIVSVISVLAGLTYDIEPDTPIRFIRNRWSDIPLSRLVSHETASFIRTMYRKGVSPIGLQQRMKIPKGTFQRVIFTNEIPFEEGDSVEKLISDHNSQVRSKRTPFTKEELERVREDIATHKYTLEQLMEKYNVTYFESRMV